ncbi:hypothetical protein [Lacticaseibacillus sp. 53-4]|uniref:hypothetical protein n=1 Tax=Lacticaseibacillus sp. 53-4 TaxID=2799575 RepID=UPI0019408A8C|nr:hypothetical protein [Lacticaseibacillus sp. 53-4]
MRKAIISAFALLMLLSFSGCGSAAATQNQTFTKKSASGLRVKAKGYSTQAFSKGNIPLNSYVKFTGRIQKKDTAGETVKKDDRLLLRNGKTKVQVMVQFQPTALKVGDRVTVYGEYYGFVKGSLIDRLPSR